MEDFEHKFKGLQGSKLCSLLKIHTKIFVMNQDGLTSMVSILAVLGAPQAHTPEKQS